MILELDETYFIESDKYNMTLKKKSVIQKGDNAGKETSYDEGYYGTLDRALAKYIHLTMNDDKDVSSVKDLMNKLDKLYDKIEEIGEEVNYKVISR